MELKGEEEQPSLLFTHGHLNYLEYKPSDPNEKIKNYDSDSDGLDDNYDLWEYDQFLDYQIRISPNL